MLYACVRVPDVADDLSQLVALGKLASPDFKGNERILGAAYYRAGRFTEALRAFEQSAASSYPRRAWDWCFLALCHHRLGHAGEARLCLQKADQWIKEADHLPKDKRRGSATPWVDWFERVEVLELRREAEALLTQKAQPAPDRE